MPYSKDCLAKWLYDNGFKEKYKKWKLSGFNKSIKPSVDRVDSNLGYSFDNIQLVAWEENRRLQAEDIKKALGSGGKRCKELLSLTQKKHFM